MSISLRFGVQTGRVALTCLAAFFGGCTVLPVPLDRGERDQLGTETRARLFANQEPISGPITLAEATARAITQQSLI